MKPKYDENPLLCYMDTDCLIYNIKTNDFCKDIVGNVKARFDMSGYSQNHPFPMGVNKGQKSYDQVCGIETKAVCIQNPKWRWEQEVQGSQEVRGEEDIGL